MMLTRRNPTILGPSIPMEGDVSTPFQEMQRLFDELERGLAAPGLVRRSPTIPRIDLVDRGEDLRLYAELPGFEPDDIHLEIERGRLTLRGQRATTVPDGYRVHRRERGELAFVRTLKLPYRIETDGVEASLRRGILEVHLPKAEDERPREIPVESV